MSAASNTALQADRMAALCEELKLAGVAESFAALATRAVETEQSFVDFLEESIDPSLQFAGAHAPQEAAKGSGKTGGLVQR